MQPSLLTAASIFRLADQGLFNRLQLSLAGLLSEHARLPRRVEPLEPNIRLFMERAARVLIFSNDRVFIHFFRDSDYLAVVI